MAPARRILIAPDKFKGTLSAPTVARALTDALTEHARATGTAIELDACPLADGGEGTTDCLARARGADLRAARVTGPLGDRVEAMYAITRPSEGPRIVSFDCASACGPALVPTDRRDPGSLTTRGVGELLLHAADAGADVVEVALGGSATIDAGVGLGSVLGWVFLDDHAGVIAHPTGNDLARIADIRQPEQDWRHNRRIRVRALCDVRTPLVGDTYEDGAAALFGPQKGATPDQAQNLDSALRRFRSLVLTRLNRPDGPPRTGAAGGLAFALRHVAGAELIDGAEAVMDACRVEERLATADLLITGEGRLDAGSFEGKLVGALARAARRSGVAWTCLAGSATPDGLRLAREFGAIRVLSLVPDPGAPVPSADQSLRRIAELAPLML